MFAVDIWETWFELRRLVWLMLILPTIDYTRIVQIRSNWVDHWFVLFTWPQYLLRLLVCLLTVVIAEHTFVLLLGAWIHELRSGIHHRALQHSWRLVQGSMLRRLIVWILIVLEILNWLARKVTWQPKSLKEVFILAIQGNLLLPFSLEPIINNLRACQVVSVDPILLGQVVGMTIDHIICT